MQAREKQNTHRRGGLAAPPRVPRRICGLANSLCPQLFFLIMYFVFIKCNMPERSVASGARLVIRASSDWTTAAARFVLSN
jgi:hypothetical protein